MIIGAFDLASRSAMIQIKTRHHCRAGDPLYEIGEHCVLGEYFETAVGNQLSHFRQDLIGLWYAISPCKALIYERVPIHFRGAKALSLQYQQYGVFLETLAFLGFDRPIIPVDPNDWHMGILGIRNNRRLLKSHAKQQATIRTGFITKDEDVADAICIGVYGMGMMNMGMIG